jgi:feruloyl-CoA synthase
MGDAIAPVDPADLARGFTFQGRIAEDFKLSTGTWVRVGPLRARFLAIAGDLIADVAIAGQGHDAVAALLFPNMAGCRAVSGLPAEASLTDIVRHPSVQAAVAERLDRYNAANPTSSTRIAHAALMDSVPSIDAGEITDKGSLNQKAVLRHRAMDVDRLYTGHDRSTL